MADEQISAQLVVLDVSDNVAVARTNIATGTRLTCGGADFAALDSVPAGHKIAVRPIQRSAAVTKYGQIIGQATSDIRPGEHVHSHNLAIVDVHADYAACSQIPDINEIIFVLLQYKIIEFKHSTHETIIISNYSFFYNDHCKLFTK